MRVHLRGDTAAREFSERPLQIGDGRSPDPKMKITLPTSLGTVVSTLKEFISRVYPDIKNLKYKPMDWLCERVILATKNETAAEVDDILLNSFQAGKIGKRLIRNATNRRHVTRLFIHHWGQR